MYYTTAAFIWGHRNNHDIYLTFWLLRCFRRVQCYLWWVRGFSYKWFPVQKSLGMWVALGSGWWWRVLLPLHRSDSPSVFVVWACFSSDWPSVTSVVIMDNCHCHFHLVLSLWFNKIVMFPQDLPMCIAGSQQRWAETSLLRMCPSLFSVPKASQ